MLPLSKLPLALISALLVLAQVVAFAHVGLVEHRTCALHGELVHPGHVTAGTAAEGRDVTAIHALRGVEEGDHDHCVCMAPGRERFVLSSSLADGLGPAMLGCAHGIQLAAAPALSIALLALAPKSSPPA